MVKEQISKVAEKSKLGPKYFEQIQKIEQKLEKLHDLYIDKIDFQKSKKRYKT